jgi:hypothetical protein
MFGRAITWRTRAGRHSVECRCLDRPMARAASRPTDGDHGIARALVAWGVRGQIASPDARAIAWALQQLCVERFRAVFDDERFDPEDRWSRQGVASLAKELSRTAAHSS